MGYKGYQEVARGYMGWQGVTALQKVTGGYSWLQEVKRGYRAYKGL